MDENMNKDFELNNGENVENIPKEEPRQYYAPETEHEYETNRKETYVVKYSEDTAEIRMDNREMSITFKFNRPIIDCSTDLINEQILLRFHAPLI